MTDAAPSRGLWIRSYLALAGGLIVAAALLDLVFSTLQQRQFEADDPWMAATFRAIERELSAVPPAARPARTHQISTRFGLEVRVIGTDDLSGRQLASNRTETARDDAGLAVYLRQSEVLNGALRIGPLPLQTRNRWLDALPVLFYLSIFAIVALWLRPLLADLRLLTGAARRFAADYRQPLDTARHVSPLKSLASDLDDMSRRLSQLIQAQKELTAALSHEIRTPLARIRFATAVLADGAASDVRRRLDDVNEDVRQVDSLVASMLEYARLDHPDQRMQWGEVPLEAWLRPVVAAAAQSDCAPLLVLPQTVAGAATRVWLDPKLMGLAVSNLVANACRYARGRVEVRVERDGSRSRIEVEDDGDGIPDAERATVFRAFTRLDDSRSRDTGGYGLGLAVVARVAALHGGTATVDVGGSLGGARFRIEWLHEA
jgi:signal transduction histidine kinase